MTLNIHGVSAVNAKPPHALGSGCHVQILSVCDIVGDEVLEIVLYGVVPITVNVAGGE